MLVLLFSASRRFFSRSYIFSLSQFQTPLRGTIPKLLDLDIVDHNLHFVDLKMKILCIRYNYLYQNFRQINYFWSQLILVSTEHFHFHQCHASIRLKITKNLASGIQIQVYCIYIYCTAVCKKLRQWFAFVCVFTNLCYL